MTDGFIIPSALREGDRVTILSPSGKIDHSFLIGARKRLASWGLNAKLSLHAGMSNGWYAGTKKHRLSDLQRAMDDEQVRAIFCSRGGYGAVHLIEELDFTRFSEHPKWLIGFSDITALHNLFQSKGFASLHAPMARHLTVEPADDPATVSLHDILFGRLPCYAVPKHKLNRYGTVQGTLRGGNLAVLYGLRGTPYDIPPEGTILFLEDVGERPHSIERMFYNLKLGGVLEKLSGLIIGQFTEFDENMSLGKELYAAIAELLKGYDYPVCFNFPVGHVTNNLPLINGAQVTLDVTGKKVTLDFGLHEAPMEAETKKHIR
jgi:muramoyltetrapeptide carboxypeptidase